MVAEPQPPPSMLDRLIQTLLELSPIRPERPGNTATLPVDQLAEGPDD
jgi:hypothetical protein